MTRDGVTPGVAREQVDAAPIPRRWHRCTPWTYATLLDGTRVDYCACGALRVHGGGAWIERNTRRRLG